MDIERRKLSESRRQFTVVLTPNDVAGHFDDALVRLASTVKVPGFRPGKAPASLVKEKIGAEELREEAYTLAVQDSWRQIVKKLTGDETPIADPEVEVRKFEAGQSAQIVFEFDIRPKVEIGNWQDIKIKNQRSKTKDERRLSEETKRTIHNLARAHARIIVTLEGASRGDRVIVNFTGSVGGIKKDKLSGTKYPIDLGSGAILPGFEDNLLGLKKGAKKTFNLSFPANHFDKEFAGQLVRFEVEVEEVFKIVEPAIDDEFAKKFGHDKIGQLRSAIKKDLQRRFEEEVFVQQKAKWLFEFEKIVKTEAPRSLIEAEVKRSRESWQKFLAERLLNADDWLKTRNITMAELEADWRKAAESSVKIGLGLTEVAKELKRNLKSNEDFQKLLEELVRKAIS